MLTTKDKETATVGSESKVCNAAGEDGRSIGLKGSDSRGDFTPLKALKRLVRWSLESECRPQDGRADLTGEFFTMLLSLVRAAQGAGEIRAGDASLITALIVGSVIGAADLSRHVRSKRECGASDLECPPLFLLDLLGTKNCN